MVDILVVTCVWAITAGIGYAIKHDLAAMIMSGSMLGICYGAYVGRQCYDLGKRKQAMGVMLGIGCAGLPTGVLIAFAWQWCAYKSALSAISLGVVGGLCNGIIVIVLSKE